MRSRDAPSATRTLSSCRRALRACEQQVGDVRAGDQQHQRDDDHDRRERALIAVAQKRVAGRRGIEGEGLLHVLLLVLLAPVLRHRRFADQRLDAAERGLRVARGLPGLQPDHGLEPPGRAAIEHALLAADERLGAERDRHLELPADLGAKELRRRDADDRERHALDGDRACR